MFLSIAQFACYGMIALHLADKLSSAAFDRIAGDVCMEQPSYGKQKALI